MQDTIRTTGDLREFLGGVLLGIKDGSIDKGMADAIAKVSSQINQSLSVEVNAIIQLKKLGENHPVAGTTLLANTAEQIASPPLAQLKPADQDGLIWCEQCDMRVEPKDAAGCKSKYCRAKA